MQFAQDISSRMYIKKRRRSGLQRGFLPISYAFAYEIYNRRNRQVKMRQLFFYSSYASHAFFLIAQLPLALNGIIFGSDIPAVSRPIGISS